MKILVALLLTVFSCSAFALSKGDSFPGPCDSTYRVLGILDNGKVLLGQFNSKGEQVWGARVSCAQIGEFVKEKKKAAVDPEVQTAELGSEGAQ